MAPTLHLLLVLFSVFSLSFESTPPFKPSTLVLPVQKDSFTSLHVANIHKRTPLQSIPFLIDLNGRLLWANCEQHYLSSTYNAPLCHSTQCSRANSNYCYKCSSRARPGCHNNTCGVLTTNPITLRTGVSELALDVLSIQSIRGSNPGPMVTVPEFLFACAPSFLFQGPLPKNVQGVAGLGHTPIALPTQLASHFGFRPQFALCLSSTTNTNGVIFFGNGPYYTRPGLDISRQLGFTPLTISPLGEYYIQVSSIRINQKPVPINTSVLSKNKQGFGGTMITTTSPYTILEHSIYRAFTQFFCSQLPNEPQVTPVAPFETCFDARKLKSTRVGYGVPSIDFVLHKQNVVWRMFGANSVVQARPGVACLAFVDGGLNPPKASIVIGAYQLENNLLQFDLARSVLGFSSSLLSQRTSCANFNFTSTP
ncbi:gamma conglutin 1-like [Cornus florida]|uniref:gamma conglutin 1-like n=1 Tax=Cornus florida TaxID=4283 RepID=UPI00289E8D18|nr:gamma conglutin 1-like [Cornus florida]